MKVLFVSSPGLGHLFPLIPLAWAFRTNGYEVVIAIAEHAERAAASGLEVVDVAPDFNSVDVFERVTADNPEFATTVGARPARNMEEWAVMIAAMNRALIDRLIAFTDDWKPDLVVYEQGATAGLFAAARAGVPAIQRNHSDIRTRGMHGAIASFLMDFHEKYEIASPLPEPSVTIEAVPPSMLVDREPEGWFMRWVPYGGGAVIDSAKVLPRVRPLVAVTMGTVELQAFGLDSVRSILAAAARVPADFVLALGDIDIAPLGELPANVRSVGWAPLDRLFRSCDCAVIHGGGTMLTAIEAGVPQLLAADPRDMFRYSGHDAVRKLGFGLISTADKISPDKISPELIMTLIEDDQLRRQTARVREEMLSLPSPAETVRRIIDEI